MKIETTVLEQQFLKKNKLISKEVENPEDAEDILKATQRLEPTNSE